MADTYPVRVAADDTYADTYHPTRPIPTDKPVVVDTAIKSVAAESTAEIATNSTDTTDYHTFLRRLRHAWTDPVDLTISYSDLAYDIPVPVTDPGIPNLLKSLYSAFTLQAWRTPHKSFLALQPSSGLMLPGRMTLVLAPPGHGKSTLLKALAGRFHGDSRLRGEVRYSGMTCQQAQQHGLHVHKLTAYVDQGDCHLAQLTVRETLQFALDNSVSDPALLQDEQFARLSAAKVDLMLDLLGLREAEHTILGNAVLRGVSGGQRRRVTIGEMMITNARALFLDEITTGLDSATSFDILHALRQWTRVMSGSTMVALLQPTPECFELFDQLILLRQGAVVYDGPIGGVREYLQSIGVPVPDDQDLADYLSDFLTDPAAVYQRTMYRATRKAWKAANTGYEAEAEAVEAKTGPEVIVRLDERKNVAYYEPQMSPSTTEHRAEEDGEQCDSSMLRSDNGQRTPSGTVKQLPKELTEEMSPAHWDEAAAAVHSPPHHSAPPSTTPSCTTTSQPHNATTSRT